MLLVRLIIFAAALAAAPAVGAKSEYILGPQDRLTIRVYNLRKNAGEAYAWAALNGEFSVGAEGSVSMPILGEVAAAGGTTADLADMISRSLKAKADLAELPSTSVEVLKYRPFYVMGAVQQPGKYDFQPGLSVLQALSIAQGIVRGDLVGIQREVVSAGGELRALGAERISLEAKKARLTAEISEARVVTYPADLTARVSDPRVAQAMGGETLRFDARRGALRAELDAIEQAKILIRQELTTLEGKAKSLDRQLEMSLRQLGLVNELVAKGLAVTPRQVAAENSRASFEGARLDTQTATLRAQQNLSRADRDAVEIRARYRKEALDEAAVTRFMLDQNAEKARTAEQLLHDAEMRSPGATEDANAPIPGYTLTRMTSSGRVTRVATEDDVIEAGDVLRVSLSRPRRHEGAATAEPTTPAPPPAISARTESYRR